MSESVTVLNHNDEDRRLLMKLQHRLLRTPVTESAPAEPDDQRLMLAFALAPMGMAFLYLILFSIFVLR